MFREGVWAVDRGLGVERGEGSGGGGRGWGRHSSRMGAGLRTRGTVEDWWGSPAVSSGQCYTKPSVSAKSHGVMEAEG